MRHLVVRRCSRAALFAVTLASIFAGACGGSGPVAPGMERLALVNATSDTVGFLALERELSSRVDPNPGLGVETLRGRVIAPGATAVVTVAEVEGYRPGADVRFFLYRVTGGYATFRAVLDVSVAELARHGYRVELAAAALGR